MEMICCRYAIIFIILYRVRNLYYEHFYGVTVRYLYNFHSKIFTSYFIHHKPVVSLLDYDNIEEHIDSQNQSKQGSAE